MSWEDRACKGLNPSLFFPEPGAAEAGIIRAVCKTCTENDECLERAMRSLDALTHSIRDTSIGWHAGKGDKELKTIWRTRRREKKAAA